MLKTIRLSGKLGERFGREYKFHLDTDTVAEAIRALDSQLKGFRSYLTTAKDRGIEFAIFIGKRNVGEDELKTPTDSEVIRIAPVLSGSKSGGLQTILGVALIVVAAIATDGASLSVSGTGAGIWGGVSAAGTAMALGGIVQMLSPQPKGVGGKETSNQPSYVFNGAVNTQAQGNPVPVLYGRMIVGSAVVSAGLDVADYAPATNGVGPGNPNWHPKTPFEAFNGGQS